MRKTQEQKEAEAEGEEEELGEKLEKPTTEPVQPGQHERHERRYEGGDEYGEK